MSVQSTPRTFVDFDNKDTHLVLLCMCVFFVFINTLGKVTKHFGLVCVSSKDHSARSSYQLSRELGLCC